MLSFSVSRCVKPHYSLSPGPGEPFAQPQPLRRGAGRAGSEGPGMKPPLSGADAAGPASARVQTPYHRGLQRIIPTGGGDDGGTPAATKPSLTVPAQLTEEGAPSAGEPLPAAGRTGTGTAQPLKRRRRQGPGRPAAPQREAKRLRAAAHRFAPGGGGGPPLRAAPRSAPPAAALPSRRPGAYLPLRGGGGRACRHFRGRDPFPEGSQGLLCQAEPPRDG